MTTSYLSFGSIAKLHNNSLLVTSPIGELSNKARTYAKDPGVFNLDSKVSETVLYNFLSQTDNVDIVMPQAIAEVQINIGDWLYTQAKNGNITGNRPNTLALLQATFSNNIEITDIGEMVTNNAIFFPSFVKGNHIVGDDKQSFYLWFAEEYFRTQYPVVSFTVVHPLPIEEMDTLMSLNYHQIETRLLKETPDVIEDRAHALTNQSAHPYTERNVVSFQIMDLVNTPNYNVGYWRFLEWGNGEDSEDQLFDQIKKEILDNSKYPESQWEDKIPDLFNPLEWYVLPYFNRLGVKNKTNGASSLSPIVDRESMMALVDHFLTPNMTADHVIKSTQVVPFLYKSLACAFVAKLNNREGMEKIDAIIPDYQLIPSTDSDFDLMSGATMDFVIKMQELLAAAETVTPINLTPAGITRIVRFGKTCVARRIGKVKYIVVTRYQYLQDGLIEE
jgi:hypothetical protein